MKKFPLEIEYPLILASASPRRKQILQELGLNPAIMPVNIDEVNHDNLNPENYAMDLAGKKAMVVSNSNPEKIVIGADTIVVLDNNILEKPVNRENAYKMLSMLSGRKHRVVSGVHLQLGKHSKTFHENTSVFFKEISDSEINWYLDTGEPYDKAGSYGIQGLGRVLISKIEGCYFNVVGFPVHHFYIKLKELLKDCKNAKV